MLSPELGAAVVDSVDYFLHLAAVLIPLFLGASFLVGLAREYLPPERIERTLRGHDEGTGNVAAAGLGAVTPFCSCSTIPVLAGLLQAGAPLGLAFSFLLASPLVNEVAVVLLVGLFGFKVAFYYVVATFLAAVVGGVVVGRLGLEGRVKDAGLIDGGSSLAADGGTTDCCAGRPAATNRTHRRRVETAAREAWSFFVETVPYLLLGTTLGALVHGVVPVEMLRAVLGSENPLAVPFAAALGAPVYMGVSGMLPIAASLSERGIAVGTVLAFVVGGAGVSIPNVVLLSKLFERRLLVVYSATVVAIAVGVGLTLNLFVA